jgi:hypothetical protein
MKQHDVCVIYYDEIVNLDEVEKQSLKGWRDYYKRVRPETGSAYMLKVQCCDMMGGLIPYFDTEGEKIGMNSPDHEGGSIFSEYECCPFCGAEIQYALRKKIRLIPETRVSAWKRVEVDSDEHRH